jgi:hypothetical protein
LCSENSYLILPGAIYCHVLNQDIDALYCEDYLIH